MSATVDPGSGRVLPRLDREAVRAHLVHVNDGSSRPPASPTGTAAFAGLALVVGAALPRSGGLPLIASAATAVQSSSSTGLVR
jgi:hypothetical protein